VWVAVSVLIVTCPCALSLAAPAALVAAAGGLARRGVMLQRLEAIEAWPGRHGLLRQDRHADRRPLRLRCSCSPGRRRPAGGRQPGRRRRWPLVAASAVAGADAERRLRRRPGGPVEEHPGQGLQARRRPRPCWQLGSLVVGGRDAAPADARALVAAQAFGSARRPVRAGFVFDEVLRVVPGQAVPTCRPTACASRCCRVTDARVRSAWRGAWASTDVVSAAPRRQDKLAPWPPRRRPGNGG
jgi:Cu2+-exporting ATPase